MVLILLLMAAGVVMLLVRAPTPPAGDAEITAPKTAPPVASSSPGAGLAASQTEAARRGSPVAAKLNAPESSPEQDLVILRDLTSQYLTALQRRAGPPIGDDADLVRALTGRNPLRLTVIPPDHPAITPEGRLLDRWGTPYHVHARSAQSFEFRSAGPDRKLFTTDDLVLP
ncbi:MAG TPA: hypothetical protein VD994_08270 [Prosthecobacter sp.]|nr:hypothetical protein [Prosthecobacter sp.]